MTRRAFGGTRAPFGGDLPGSPAAPFASTAERDAVMPAGVPRRKCYMLNPFNPIAAGVPGIVEFVDNGTAWVLSQNQVIANFRNFNGSPILDRDASLLTVGVVADVWMSPELPLWMFDSAVSVFCDVACSDSVSVATVKLLVGIRSAPLADNLSVCFLSSSRGTSPVMRGVSVLGNFGRCVSGNIVGVSGDGQTANFIQETNIGDYEANPKARIAYVPGATTNKIRAYSIVIKSGVC